MFPLHKRFLTSIAICLENRLLVNKNVNSPLQLWANSFPSGKSGSASPEIDRPFISTIFYSFFYISYWPDAQLVCIQCSECLPVTMCNIDSLAARPIVYERKVALFLYGVHILTSIAMIYRGPFPWKRRRAFSGPDMNSNTDSRYQLFTIKVFRDIRISHWKGVICLEKKSNRKQFHINFVHRGRGISKKSKYANLIQNLGLGAHTLAVIRLTP